MNIAVLCSGNGTNLQAIIDNVEKGRIKADIAFVLSDKKDAFALERARRSGIPAIILDKKDYKSRDDFDREISANLVKHKVELVVLAGYMRLLSGSFIKEFRNRIMNIHPSLLPSFKGTSAVKDAFEYGVKVTGATVHFVDEELDNGPIILQKCVQIKEDDTEETILERVHEAEHEIYPEAVRLFVEGRLKITGRKVAIKR